MEWALLHLAVHPAEGHLSGRVAGLCRKAYRVVWAATPGVRHVPSRSGGGRPAAVRGRPEAQPAGRCHARGGPRACCAGGADVGSRPQERLRARAVGADRRPVPPVPQAGEQRANLLCSSKHTTQCGMGPLEGQGKLQGPPADCMWLLASRAASLVHACRPGMSGHV